MRGPVSRPRRIATASLACVFALAGCNADLGALVNVTPSPTPLAIWSYEGDTGPDHWAALSSDWQTCGTGTEQSPVALPARGAQVVASLELDYEESQGLVRNDDHSVSLELDDGGGIVLDGKEYAFVEARFHAPSEHTFGGDSAVMEVQILNESEDGEMVVLAVPLEEGEAIHQLGEAMDHVPNRGVRVELDQPLSPERLLAQERRAFRYTGSLSFPPCTEGVEWIVFNDTRSIGASQIAGFRRVYASNVRPVQPLNDRTINEP